MVREERQQRRLGLGGVEFRSYDDRGGLVDRERNPSINFSSFDLVLDANSSFVVARRSSHRRRDFQYHQRSIEMVSVRKKEGSSQRRRCVGGSTWNSLQLDLVVVVVLTAWEEFLGRPSTQSRGQGSVGR